MVTASPKRLRDALLFAVCTARIASSAPAEHWAPTPIASSQFESHAAFDPATGDLYFVRSSPSFEGWRMVRSRCTPTGWSTPQEPPFAGDGVEADPFFTPDGRSLYFISTRGGRKDLDLWRVDRDLDGSWGVPERLPEPVNSSGQEWFPRPGTDGWLYFGSNREGGLGRTDIWRARREGARGWTVENAGPAINTAADEYEPLPSPDGQELIVMAAGGLYRSRRAGDGWTPREKLGPEVNHDGSEIGAAFSPSGRSLLFSRDTKARASGEFFVARLRGQEAWPPACPGGSLAASPPSDAHDLWRKTQALVDAVAPGDVGVWRELLDERMLSVDENGTMRTKNQLLDEFRPLPAGLVGSLRVDSLRVEVHGDVALVAHEDDERLDYHGQAVGTRFRTLDTWKRTPDGWRQIASQVMAVLEDPPRSRQALDPACPYAGLFVLVGDAPDITTRLTCEGDHLVSRREARPPTIFQPETADVFFQPGQPRSRRLFERDAAGLVTGFLDRREGHDLAWRRVP